MTLTLLEIVLGVDNIIFISILSGKLPEPSRRAPAVGLCWRGASGPVAVLACMDRRLTDAAVHRRARNLRPRSDPDRWRVVPVGKSTYEIHDRWKGTKGTPVEQARPPRSRSVIVQIMLIDIVFSLDSVITAVGMVDELCGHGHCRRSSRSASCWSRPSRSATSWISHPTVKMLALSFLVLIGMSLLAEGFDQHIPKGYIYFAMGFSVFVEMLNLRIRRSRLRCT